MFFQVAKIEFKGAVYYGPWQKDLICDHLRVGPFLGKFMQGGGGICMYKFAQEILCEYCQKGHTSAALRVFNNLEVHCDWVFFRNENEIRIGDTSDIIQWVCVGVLIIGLCS